MELDIFKDIVKTYNVCVKIEGKKQHVFTFYYEGLRSIDDIVMKMAVVHKQQGVEAVYQTLLKTKQRYSGLHYVIEVGVEPKGIFPKQGHKNVEILTKEIIVSTISTKGTKSSPSSLAVHKFTEKLIEDFRVNIDTGEKVTLFNFDIYNKQY